MEEKMLGFGNVVSTHFDLEPNN